MSQNNLHPMTIVARVNRQHDILDEKGKERVREMIKRVALERAERARKERVEIERVEILQRFEERAQKAQAEAKDLRVLQIYKNDFKRAYALREAEKRQPSEGGLVSLGAQLQAFLDQQVERPVVDSRVLETEKIRKEFVLLLEIVPRDVLASALDLLGSEVEETWLGLESLQDAIEVALDL